MEKLEEMVKQDSTQKWRFLRPGLKSGIFNTALDEAIRKSVELKKSPPTIMITEWKPTISLGRIQSYSSDVNKEFCEKKGIEVVRRKSGGQAVFLNKGYIVASVIAPREYFLSEYLTDLRRDFSNCLADSLKEIGIDAEFHDADNVIIKNEEMKRIIGNAGQMTGKVNVLHGSLRYNLDDFDSFLNGLKVKDQEIFEYRENIEKVLASVTDYKNITKEEMTKVIVNNLEKMYVKNGILNGEISEGENKIVEELIKNQYSAHNLRDQENYKAKGICHLTLNGKHVVEEIDKILPYNPPSTYKESTV